MAVVMGMLLMVCGALTGLLALAAAEMEKNPIALILIAIFIVFAGVGAGIAHDHYRLESGQSTENIMEITASIRDLQSFRQGKTTR